MILNCEAVLGICFITESGITPLRASIFNPLTSGPTYGSTPLPPPDDPLSPVVEATPGSGLGGAGGGVGRGGSVQGSA